MAYGHAERNLAFLRQSEIRIEIDYAVEPHIDRVIELINRSNQLNYTKVRVETDEARQNLLESIKAFGFNAGVVRVWDKYGDYGIVGFFMALATLREYRLEQFVFSNGRRTVRLRLSEPSRDPHRRVGRQPHRRLPGDRLDRERHVRVADREHAAVDAHHRHAELVRRHRWPFLIQLSLPAPQFSTPAFITLIK